VYTLYCIDTTYTDTDSIYRSLKFPCSSSALPHVSNNAVTVCCAEMAWSRFGSMELRLMLMEFCHGAA